MKIPSTFSKKSWLVILLLPLCVLSGWFAHQFIQTTPIAITEFREDNVGDIKYKFIKPLLIITTPEDTGTYADLKEELTNYVRKVEQAGQATKVSIYFRDLEGSKWIGVDETETYRPSSMLKVLITIAYLRDAEQSPLLLTEKLPYTPSVNIQYYPPASTLPQGSYTASDLISRMIIDSDNDAAISLLNRVNKSALDDAYESLHLAQETATSTREDFMTPQEYSRLFRVLYNATYLSRSLSEQVLSLLTYTTFTEGLVAGVPKDIPVSHKFGENTKEVEGVKEQQLHDCGIIYTTPHPYFLCVMTQGSDFPTLASIISTVSKITYQSIEKDALR